MIGEKFGKLTVIERSNEKLKTKGGKIRSGRTYLCKCDCGNTCIAYKSDLKRTGSRQKKSCGCIGAGGHNKIDLTGKRFGKLTVIKQIETPEKHKNKRTNAFWECKCDCGNTTIVIGTSLRKGTKSCGCLSRLQEQYDITDQKFGKLIAKEIVGHTKKGLVIWKCVCKCGNEVDVTGNQLRTGRKKSCGCLQKLTGKKHHSWNGYKGIYKNNWTRIISNSKTRKLPFNITIEYVWELFIKQNKRCALSGVPLTFAPSYKPEEHTASLDRIDSSKGYVEGNVQWVHKKVNKIKMDMSDKEFIDWCKKVTEHNEHKRIKRQRFTEIPQTI